MSRVAQWRRRLGLTQRELAERSGLSLGTIRDLEQGRVRLPRPDSLRRLADALEVSIADLGDLAGAENGDGSRARRRPGTKLRITVLGPLTASRGGALVDLGGAKQRAVLALLALSVNQPVGRATIIDAVWGENAPRSAVNLVQTYIGRLRRALTPPGAPGRATLLSSPGGYRLQLADDQVDLAEFRSLVGQARRLRAAGDTAGACDRYARALALWRGQPVSDVEILRGHAAVTVLAGERLGAALEFADAAAQIDADDRAVTALTAVAAAEPLHGGLHARLMLALARTGHQARALQVYDDVRRRLAEELGVDPDPELAAAHRAILRGQVVPAAGLATAVPAAPAASDPTGPPAPTTGTPEPGTALAATGGIASRQLPADLPDFTGREAELAALLAAASPAGDRASFVVISAIEGMAGVGKTRLALRAAHRLASSGHFDDLHLYADLRGYAADQVPADPSGVLESFLRSLGVPGDQIPASLDARAAAYRNQLHGRRALVLLDNAANEAQVAPLLPSDPGCFVIVTSRRSLALDGAQIVNLDVFSLEEALDLLARIAGRARIEAEPQAARRVVELCGCLPIAVALVAHRLRARPAWTVADLAQRIEREDRRLGELAAGTRAVRATFAISYRSLPPAEQRLFRLLGRYPGGEISAGGAAALAGLDHATTDELLQSLVDQHLIQEVAPRRYRFHDLMRAYAAERAVEVEDPGQLEAAVERLLDWLLYTADAAERAVSSHQRYITLDLAAAPPLVPTFATASDALDWLETEYPTLIAAVDYAAASGHPGTAWRLTALTWHFLNIRKLFNTWLALNRVALEAARRDGDLAAEAMVLHSTGAVYAQRHEYDTAIDHLRRALELRETIGDLLDQSTTLTVLGSTYAMSNQPEQAVDCLRRAVDICRDGADRPATAQALHNLGSFLVMYKEYEEGIHWLEQAAETWPDTRHFGAGHTLVNLAEAYLNLGRQQPALDALDRADEISRQLRSDYISGMATSLRAACYLSLGRIDEAVTAATRAVEIFETLDDQLEVGQALDRLGQALAARGDRASAVARWRDALTIFEKLGHPYAAEVRNKLDESDSPQAG